MKKNQKPSLTALQKARIELQELNNALAQSKYEMEKWKIEALELKYELMKMPKPEPNKPPVVQKATRLCDKCAKKASCPFLGGSTEIVRMFANSTNWACFQKVPNGFEIETDLLIPRSGDALN